jgi:Cytochrome C oxidase, cbb3-type, subunit III
MEKILLIHKISAGIFLLVYLVKGIFIFRAEESRKKVFSKIKLLEIPVSFLFLATGIYLLFFLGHPPLFIMIKILLVLVAIPLAIIGQKRSKPIFLWLSILLIVYVFGVSETRSLNFQKPKMEYLADDGSGANFELLNIGSHIYGEHCLRCHGKNGDLERYGAKKLSLSTLSPEKRREIIMKGKGDMPNFKKKIDLSELEGLELFIERFSKQ